MNALVAKYMLLTLPSINPSRQVSGSRQFGHHARLRFGVSLRLGAPGGDNVASAMPISRVGTAHTTNTSRQLSATNGNTSGIVSATGKISPNNKPLV